MNKNSGKTYLWKLHPSLMSLVVYSGLISLVMLLVPGSLFADPFETIGLGGRNLAMGGAVSAIAEDYTATHYNPASLAFAEKPSIGSGFTYGSLNMSVNGEKHGIPPIRAFQAGGTFPLSRGRLRIVKVGVAANLPTSAFYNTISQDAKKPNFVFYANHPHRLALKACAGIKILPWLSIGGGIDLMSQMTFDEELQFFNPDETFLETTTPLKAKYVPLAGVRVKATEALSFAAVYRGETSTTAVIDVILSSFDVPMVPTTKTYISNYYKPHEIVLGVSYRFGKKLLVGVDVAWMDYSKTETAQPVYEVEVPMAVRIALSIINVPPPGFQDIFVPRIGGEYVINDHVVLRSGYCYKASPVPEQTGITNYCDADKHVVSLGAGLSFSDPWELMKGPINIDAVFQTQIFETRSMIKDDPNDPVGDYTIEGNILLGGIFVNHTF